MANETNKNGNGSADNNGSAGQSDHTLKIDAPQEMGSYRLTRLLGRGGMGEVWLAFDKHLERDVAIKLMRKELLSNEDATRRFAREARAVARLNHPNIVQVYAFGDEKGILYFVMELVDGETVTQKMKRERCLSLPDAVSIMMQAIEGLGYACERGIIHRDIKPSNLMLTKDNRVKIADFGLAKMVEHDTQMTAAGTAMGSPNYMSPEQARGEEADHRSDIYALGVSLYQMLCGGLPFTASSPVSVLIKQIQEPLPEPDDLRMLGQGAVLSVIKKMTAKQPAQRYQTYEELAAAMAALQPGSKFSGAHTATSSMPAAVTNGDSSATISATAQTGNEAQTKPGSPPPPPTPAADSPQPVAPPSPAPPTRSEEATNKTMFFAAAAIVLLCILGVVVGLMLMPDFSQLNPLTESSSSDSNSAAQTDPDTNVQSAAVTNQNVPVTATPTPSDPSAGVATMPTSTPQATRTARPSPSAPGASASPAASPAQPTSPATSTTPTPATNQPGTMQPLNITTAIGSPTPFPGVVLSPTPTPRLEDLLPQGVPLPDQRPADMIAASQSQVYVLGTAGAGPDEMVPAYRDKDGRILIKTYPAGTEVTLIGSSPTMYRVMTPDKQALYVYKKMASRK